MNGEDMVGRWNLWHRYKNESGQFSSLKTLESAWRISNTDTLEVKNDRY